jgi:hypothetical protein
MLNIGPVCAPMSFCRPNYSDSLIIISLKIAEARDMILVSFFLWISFAWTKVDPPNYQFTLDQLAPFFPGQPASTIRGKWGKGLKLKSLGDSELWQFEVIYVRYKFPVLVQLKADMVQDMFATLPSYFLHDVFHQSLINKWGKQQNYVKKDEAAVYEWNQNNLKITYSAACTITCFPIFLHVSQSKEGFKSQLDWLKEQSHLE